MRASSRITLAIAMACALAGITTPASGQRLEPAGVHRSTSTPALGLAPRATASDSAHRGRKVVRGALVGTAAGGIVGFGAAFVMTQGSYPDHSEDGLAYIALPLLGATLGLLIGTIVGALGY